MQVGMELAFESELLERRDALDRLNRLFTGAASGRGWVVVGPACIGDTRLGGAARRAAAEHWRRCTLVPPTAGSGLVVRWRR